MCPIGQFPFEQVDFISRYQTQVVLHFAHREKLDDFVNQLDAADECGIEYDLSQSSRLSAHVVTTFGTHLNLKLREHVQGIQHEWAQLLDDIIEDVLPDMASDEGW